jgi:hypothetical protein
MRLARFPRGAHAAIDGSTHQRIAAAAAGEPPLHAPAHLLGSVMDAVYRESMRGPVEPEAPAVPTRTYRRMGLSFVLSAALVVAALLVPPGLLPSAVRPDGLAVALNAEGQSVVRSALVGANALVRGALTPDVEGGTQR